MQLSEIVFWTFTVYVAIGMSIAIPFVFHGVNAVDPNARGAPLGFRMLIIPGVCALWPVIGTKWVRVSLASRRQP